MLEWLEIFCRWVLGLQFLFWGLNGFFHWRPIPPSAQPINDFTEACIKTRFIMPTVKIFEIAFGALLLTGKATIVAWAALAPIVFIISGLHLLYNKKYWEVLLPITLPFLLILVLNFEKWQNLLLPESLFHKILG
ncbi:hypothetical protein [Bdellovibrio sp. HCB337]|uniref:hypothetical protein n=1 Tax=Bdellovibrio sp. HCB337 TaxID=3394358 RepID=UPI0039A68B92